jgi:hypothetical protein
VVVAYADVPLMRHYSSTYKFFGAIPSGQLVVRMISSVYNYDYIQDLELKVDGTISVKVYTTGYAQTGPAMPDYPHHYGYPLFQDVSGGNSGQAQTSAVLQYAVCDIVCGHNAAIAAAAVAAAAAATVLEPVAPGVCSAQFHVTLNSLTFVSLHLLLMFSGTVHTQALAWKVDLDIAGTHNSVKLHTIKVRLSQDALCLAACVGCSLVVGDAAVVVAQTYTFSGLQVKHPPYCVSKVAACDMRIFIPVTVELRPVPPCYKAQYRWP